MFPSVPSAGLQIPQIRGPEYVDPLESLARMRQGQAQNIQLQNQQMQQQALQMKLASKKKMMDIIARGGDEVQMAAAMRREGVDPDDFQQFESNALIHKTNIQALSNAEKAALDRNIDKYMGQVESSDQSWASLKEINERAEAEGLFKVGGESFQPIAEWTEEGQLKAQKGALMGLKAMNQRELQAAELKRTELGIEAAKEQIEVSKGARKKLGIEISGARRDQAVAELQGLPEDPNRKGIPELVSWNAFWNKYAGPDVPQEERLDLPKTPSPEFIKNFKASAVPEAARPAYQKGIAEAGQPQDIVDIAIAVNDPNLSVEKRKQYEETLKTIAAQQPGNAEVKLADTAKNDPDPAKRKAAENTLDRLSQYRREGTRPSLGIGGGYVIPGLGPGGAGATGETTGEEFLKTLPPATAAQVQAIAEGRDQMPSAQSRNPSAIALRNAVYRYDPKFSAQRVRVRNAFATGKAADNIGALNTATVHLEQFYDAAQAMKNGTFQPKNQAYQYWRRIFGSNLPTNFDAIKVAVAGEIANALKGNATDIEIAQVKESLQAVQSPEQLAGVVQTHMHTLGAKLNTYYERGLEMGLTNFNPLLPAAQKAFTRIGVNPLAPGQAHAAPAAPPAGAAAPSAAPGQMPGRPTLQLKSGRTATFGTQAEADKFKREHPELVR